MRRNARSLLALVLAAATLGCGPAADGAGGNGSELPGPASGRVSGTGSSGLRVRAKPTTASDVVTTLDEGAAIRVACQTDGEVIDGVPTWDRLVAPEGYVAHAFVLLDAGEEPPPRCDALDAASAPPSPRAGGTGPVDVEGPAVRPHVQAFADAACREVGACRATTREGHQPSADLALDFPTGDGYGQVPTDGHAFGDALAAFAIGHRGEFRVDYVIYRQRLHQGDGWEPMEDRGGVTENHFDHVHVSFYP